MAADTAGAEWAMVRVGRRDVGPVAWRMALEFARPDRSRSPIVALAVAMTPMFVLIALVPGSYHWSRLLGAAAVGVDHITTDAALADWAETRTE